MPMPMPAVGAGVAASALYIVGGAGGEDVRVDS